MTLPLPFDLDAATRWLDASTPEQRRAVWNRVGHCGYSADQIKAELWKLALMNPKRLLAQLPENE